MGPRGLPGDFRNHYIPSTLEVSRHRELKEQHPKESKILWSQRLDLFFGWFFFLVALRFEFRACGLLGRCFYRLSHSANPFLWCVFSR
jgi:hypothetical protein